MDKAQTFPREEVLLITGDPPQGSAPVDEVEVAGSSEEKEEAVAAFPSTAAREEAAARIRTLLLAPLKPAGFWSIVWAIGNLALNYDFITTRGNHPFAQAIAILSAVMFIEGLFCLFCPSPAMFLWDALIFFALALVNGVGGIPILGAFQAYVGFKQFVQYGKVSRRLDEEIGKLAEDASGSAALALTRPYSTRP